MKTLILGDIHGRDIWEDIFNKELPDKVVFMGDYFDSFDVAGVLQIDNFKKIIKFKEDNPQVDIIMLFGNHDHHYMYDSPYSGYQYNFAPQIRMLLKDNLHHLRLAYKLDDLLFSHAGISPVWCDDKLDKWSKSTLVNQINELYHTNPEAFNFQHTSFDPYGNSVDQTPIWIRPSALMMSNKGDDGLKNHFIQIVGHTQVKDIFDSFTASEKAMGSRYYLVDNLEKGGYVIYEDGELIPKKL